MLVAIAVVFSLSISFGRLILSRQLEKKRIQEINSTIEKLAASEERFRTLFEGSPVGIGVLDADGRKIAANDAYRNLIGVDAGEKVTFKLLTSLTAPEEREAGRIIFEQVATGARPVARREKQYHRRDGKKVSAELSLFA